MEGIDVTASIKKVCAKKVTGDAALLSDDSVPDSPVFSVELISVDATSEDPMVPITPHSKCEGVDYRLGLNDSPSPLGFLAQKLLYCGSECEGGGFLKDECHSMSPFSSSNQHCDTRMEDSGFSCEDSPRTPKKDVFDPFAPGPDKLNLAPYRRKYAEESKVYVARKLKFGLCSKFALNSEDLFNSKEEVCSKFAPSNEDLSVSEEEILFQSVYSELLEVIVSTQTKESGKVSPELPFYDGCQTPIVPPLLTGIADTCPGAPVKISNRFRRIDKEICRQLEF